MNNIPLNHLIAPKKVIRGPRAWKEGLELIPGITTKPLLLGKSSATSILRKKIYNDITNQTGNVIFNELKYGCCEYDLQRIQNTILNRNCDGIIAAGGGKVMDSGKLIANRLGIPCITIPLSAATCAGWTALSNIYSEEGAFIKDIELNQCPDLLVFDHKFISQAPTRTLASGIADALAKWYESSFSSGNSEDGLVQQAVQMARVLRDQLLIDGLKGYKKNTTKSWVKVAEGCGLTAGLIGGIGGSECRSAIAHALHNGLTQIGSKQQALHGELVGFGVLVQLYLEELITNNKLAKQSRLQLLPYMKQLQLPTCLEDLGLAKMSIQELRVVCDFAIENYQKASIYRNEITSSKLLEALIFTSEESKFIEQKNYISHK